MALQSAKAVSTSKRKKIAGR